MPTMKLFSLRRHISFRTPNHRTASTFDDMFSCTIDVRKRSFRSDGKHRRLSFLPTFIDPSDIMCTSTVTFTALCRSNDQEYDHRTALSLANSISHISRRKLWSASVLTFPRKNKVPKQRLRLHQYLLSSRRTCTVILLMQIDAMTTRKHSGIIRQTVQASSKTRQSISGLHS